MNEDFGKKGLNDYASASASALRLRMLVPPNPAQTCHRRVDRFESRAQVQPSVRMLFGTPTNGLHDDDIRPSDLMRALVVRVQNLLLRHDLAHFVRALQPQSQDPMLLFVRHAHVTSARPRIPAIASLHAEHRRLVADEEGLNQRI